MMQKICYAIVRRASYIFCKIMFRVEFIGRENLPQNGVILAPNHTSYFDPVLVGAGLVRPVAYMARDTLFRNKLFGSIISLVYAFPIKRGRMDKVVLDKFIVLLKKGMALLVFPEGTRSLDGNLGRPKPGIGIIALSAEVPVVPVYIDGGYKVWPKGAKIIKPVKVKVYYGKPMKFENIIKDDSIVFNDKARLIAGAIVEELDKMKKEVS
jgi:1-acyl-sn-glycerol-3-phosphate acyltransferase